LGGGHSVNFSPAGDKHIENILAQNLKMGITATKVGVYHSHPGLTVFMSPGDIRINRTEQMHSNEHVSVVIDPIESVENGRLEIGAFRRWHSSKSCFQVLLSF
jgi:COP9 signalosome complex subunit 5